MGDKLGSIHCTHRKHRPWLSGRTWLLQTFPRCFLRTVTPGSAKHWQRIASSHVFCRDVSRSEEAGVTTQKGLRRQKEVYEMWPICSETNLICKFFIVSVSNLFCIFLFGRVTVCLRPVVIRLTSSQRKNDVTFFLISFRLMHFLPQYVRSTGYFALFLE